MKAVIPAAGLGTRLLPTTKSVPKELFPVRGKPAIQWVLEEAVEAGLREFIVVVSSLKPALRHYLTPLENSHPLKGHPDLRELDKLLAEITLAFVDQPVPQGLGDAILRCRPFLGDEPFALLMPDNVCPEGVNLTEKLLKVHEKYGKSCVIIRPTSTEPRACGAFVTRPIREPVHEITRVIPRDAPQAETAPMEGIGRTILEPSALQYLESARTASAGDESPALIGLAGEGRLLGVLVKEKILHLGGTNQKNSRE